jgi:hypothetical protein
MISLFNHPTPREARKFVWESRGEMIAVLALILFKQTVLAALVVDHLW